MTRQLLLAQHPVRLPDRHCWRIVEMPNPEVDGDEMLVAVHLCLDPPCVGGWMRDAPLISAAGVTAVPSSQSDVAVGDESVGRR
jgi:hypothetical protein